MPPRAEEGVSRIPLVSLREFNAKGDEDGPFIRLARFGYEP